MNENREYSVTITPGTMFLMMVFVLAAWFFYEIRELIPLILCSVIFATALLPGKKFLSRFHIPEPIALVLMYLLVFILFSFFVYSFIPLIATQYELFANALPQLVEKLSNLISGTPFESFFDSQLELLKNGDNISKFLNNALKFTAESFYALFGNIINIVLFFVLTFLFAVKPEIIDSFIKIVTPRKYTEYGINLWVNSQIKLGQWFQGQLLLVLIIGILTYFALLIVGIPNPLFLAFFAGCMELIPIFGPFLAAIPAVLMALTLNDSYSVLLVIGVFVLIQQLENNLIYPLVVTKVVGIPSVLVVLAILIGSYIAGFVGIIIAVPLVAVIQEFCKDIQKGKLDEIV